MFDLDPGQLAGLGGGLGEFGKQFVSTDLARRRLALMEQGLEQERLQAGQRRRMLEEERDAERKRREIEEKQEAETRERETKLLQDYAIPYLKEKGGKEWAGITPEMAEDLPFEQIWSSYVEARRFEKRVPTVKTPASAIMTYDKATKIMERGTTNNWIASDGNKYTVVKPWVPEFVKGLPPKWGISTKGMRTRDDVEKTIKRGKQEEIVKKEEERFDIVRGFRKYVLRKKPAISFEDFPAWNVYEKQFRDAGASPVEIRRAKKEYLEAKKAYIERYRAR